MAYANHMMRAQAHRSGPRATHHKRRALSHLAPRVTPDAEVPYVVDLDVEETQGELLPPDYVDPTPYFLDMRALVEPDRLALAPRHSDRLVFHSASKHVRVPGTGEIVANPADYAELNRIADWRRTLSNFDVREFEWGGTGTFPRGTRWNTIEHAYHASKYAVVASMCESDGRRRLLQRVAATLIKDPGAAAAADGEPFKRSKTLTDAYVDTMPPIGNGTGADAKKRGRDVALDKRELRLWDSRSRAVMESIARAKFLAHMDVQRVLLATRDARLYHLLARVTSVDDKNLDRFTHLERIRDELRAAREEP
jgi:predicted NAD-dependent protein-ADP-ribosyltransferase YbiA (DUF1768 family)